MLALALALASPRAPDTLVVTAEAYLASYWTLASSNSPAARVSSSAGAALPAGKKVDLRMWDSLISALT